MLKRPVWLGYFPKLTNAKLSNAKAPKIEKDLRFAFAWLYPFWCEISLKLQAHSFLPFNRMRPKGPEDSGEYLSFRQSPSHGPLRQPQSVTSKVVLLYASAFIHSGYEAYLTPQRPNCIAQLHTWAQKELCSWYAHNHNYYEVPQGGKPQTWGPKAHSPRIFVE